MIRRFMDCSSAHISPNSARWLDEQGRIAAACETSQDEMPEIHVARFTSGWCFYADADATLMGDAPEDVTRLMAKARSLRCEYVMVDCDGPLIKGMPVYDW